MKTTKDNDGKGRKGGGSSITEEEWRMTESMKEDRRQWRLLVEDEIMMYLNGKGRSRRRMEGMEGMEEDEEGESWR